MFTCPFEGRKKESSYLFNWFVIKHERHGKIKNQLFFFFIYIMYPLKTLAIMALYKFLSFLSLNKSFVITHKPCTVIRLLSGLCVFFSVIIASNLSCGYHIFQAPFSHYVAQTFKLSLTDV